MSYNLPHFITKLLIIKRLLITIFLSMLTFAACSQDDASKKINARVYDQPIYEENLNPSEDEMKYFKAHCKDYNQCLIDHRVQTLKILITKPLFEKFIKDHKISVNAQEIEALKNALYKNMNFDDLTKQELEYKNKIENEVATSMIIGWKINKLLYKKYGGDVIFQQADPVEPIGANEAYLKDQEKAQIFIIYDPEYKTAFWAYYQLPRIVIPKEEVNFDVPWWLRIN